MRIGFETLNKHDIKYRSSDRYHIDRFIHLVYTIMVRGRKKTKTEHVSNNDSDIIDRFLISNVSNNVELSLDIKIVEKIYIEILLANNFNKNDISTLENNRYFEEYLWPLFLQEELGSNIPLSPSMEYLVTSMTLIFLHNKKLSFLKDSENTKYISSWIHYSFNHCIYYSTKPDLCIPYFSFLKYCFLNIDDPIIRQLCLKYTTITIWKYLSPSFLEKSLSQDTLILKAWKKLKQDTQIYPFYSPDQCLYELIRSWKEQLLSNTKNPQLIDFFTLLLSQMPTRRFLVDILYDQCIPYYLLIKSDECDIILFLSMLISSENTAIPTIDSLYINQLYHIESLQKIAFQYFREELESLALLAPSELFKDAIHVQELLSTINIDTKRQFLIKCGLISQDFAIEANHLCKELLDAIFLFSCQSIQYHPVYLQSKNDVQLSTLTLQYTSLSDYLFRHLTLYRTEHYYIIEQHVTAAISKLKPRFEIDRIEMTGWCKSAVPIHFINQTPYSINVCYLSHHSNESWSEDINHGDFLALIKLSDSLSIESMILGKFISFIDSNGNESKKSQQGNERMLRLALQDHVQSLETFHIMSRIECNNFPRTLSLLKNMLNGSFPARLPEWLQDFYLGYGNSPQNKNDINTLNCIVTLPGADEMQFIVEKIQKILSTRDEKIIFMTRSISTIDQLFHKISNISDASYIATLDCDGFWSSSNRIEYIQQERMRLLSLVDKLAVSLGLTVADYGSSCETAKNFFITHIQPLWQTWLSKNDMFPFLDFLFLEDRTNSVEEWIDIYKRHIEYIFISLEKLKPFEIIKSSQEQQIYYKNQMARMFGILHQSGHCITESIYRDWQNDTVTLIVHESNSALEIEIGLVLLVMGSLIKNVILIGDGQSFPTIHCSRLSNDQYFDLSLFSRMSRLGVNSINLDR